MILEVTRGHLRIKVGNRTATLQGEMFFPGNNKMGFVLYRDSMKFWDEPNQNESISSSDAEQIITEIEEDFAKGGHQFEIE